MNHQPQVVYPKRTRTVSLGNVDAAFVEEWGGHACSGRRVLWVWQNGKRGWRADDCGGGGMRRQCTPNHRLVRVAFLPAARNPVLSLVLSSFVPPSSLTFIHWSWKVTVTRVVNAARSLNTVNAVGRGSTLARWLTDWRSFLISWTDDDT